MRQSQRVLLAAELAHKPEDVDGRKHVHPGLNVFDDSHALRGTDLHRRHLRIPSHISLRSRQHDHEHPQERAHEH